MTANETFPLRRQVAEENCWDTTPLYSNREAWTKDFQLVYAKKDYPFWPELSLTHYTLENPESLHTLLTKTFAIERQLDKLYTYAHLIHDQDITHPEAIADYQSITHLYTLFKEETAWIQPSLIALSLDKTEELLCHPFLSPYKFYLEKIFRLSLHTGTPNEEKILASSFTALNVSNKVFSSLSDSEIPFGEAQDSKKQKHPLSHALTSFYMQSTDRELRRTAYLAQCERYYNYRHTFANLLDGKIQAHLFAARARNYSSCLDAALFQNNIPTSVYFTLIEEIKKHTFLINRYFTLKKKVLQLKDFHFYDIYAPISSVEQKHYSYEEGVHLISESLQPLGSEYIHLLRKGLLSDRWVDRYENKNKRSGAYSSGCYDSPPYILLNYTNTLYDVSIIAHEVGHSMHSYFSRKYQPYHDAQYPIFLAEIASTLNEMLLMHGLAEVSESKEEKITIITRTLDTIFATLFRQTLFATFEYEIHSAAEQGVPLTEEFLSSMYRNLQEEFYGTVITFDPFSSLEWARIPHFYYNFYVYQYAIGIIASLSFVEKILNKEPKAVDLYLSFLKSGGSDFPLHILQKSGLDLQTTSPLEKAFTFITKQMDSLSSLISIN
ncbi:oligoendopeptidase F [Candidatus Chlamydia sanziniae]|uniref:Oligopeptidase F n=1 Tax=Candidatus Chlamydia sanziniae TaxID=1806891 RepID=A0A1A9HVQ4_9CHLA|nr:oligoendopeptidase F [Candidatus Chlamydia sanziniae]ANH78915.1 Oligoendopeptidase F [Candidatus Chlamydia sanziniae]